ncbi:MULTISPECIES: LysE family translocator [Clostridium]|jgi:threonine/homoserine/homoserine lactone efflux protein|uniref:Lysine exporter protein n=2 Tax=Clostridium butyricum TaxID=1492 RepID=C4IMS4_CLOBU|nr:MULTISPECIES: LysE family transporter [Clostridium]ETI91988.1 MAG: LysE type translocator [Clostridium butyricum DORA_1]ALP88873.1 lysine transporter LysE [Clostridium butyricum]ALS18476.1 lysine transporter LysE [Clostridium butyricum]ANF15604.1 lysine transporter LysE [Clostridium butyricum]AOR95550.1 lysine transporter LysE [Clostridium butyricum]
MFSLLTICKAIFIGFLTGFTASIPLGPSGLESVNRSMSKGFREGFKVSLGAVSADLLYIVIINLGLFTLLSKHRNFQSIFWIVSGVILILFNRLSFTDSKKKTDSKNLLNKYTSNGFVTGFLITFVNPTTPSLWIALSTTVLSVWRYHGRIYFLTSVSSMMIGSITWFCLLNILVSKGVRKLKSDYTKTTSKLLNYFLMILGISFIILGIFKFIK